MSDRSENIRINTYINNAQAQAAIIEQEKLYKSLRAEQKKLAVGTQEWIDKQKQINAATDKMKDYRKSVDTSSMSIKQMQTHLQALKGAFAHIPQGTKEFKEMRQEIERVKSKMTEAQTGLSGWRKTWASVGAETKLMLGGAVAALGIDALIGKMQGMVKARAEISDALAGISKASGMTMEQAAQVDKQLMAMQTRTSIEDLRAMAVEAGKAGAGSVDAVMKAVQESNVIMVALGDDLGAEAVSQMGKLSEIYGTGVLNIGSAVNAAADSSRASAGYQVEFLNRLSGVANTADVAAESIIGYGVALELNGQKTEAAGTALNDFFIEFVKDTEKFGKTAGFARGELQKLLDEKGTNEAFLQFLTRLKEGSASSKDLLQKLEAVGITGTRGASTFLTLANSIGTVRSQQELATKSIANGNSVMNEYNKVNNNFAATIEKTQKKIGLWFSTSGIAKALEGGITGFSNWLKTTSESATEAAQAFDLQKEKVQNLEAVLPGLLKRHEDLKSKTKLSKDEQAELATVIQNIATLMPDAVTQVDKYGKAIGVSAEKVEWLLKAEKDMLAFRNKDAVQTQYEASLDIMQQIIKAQAELNFKKQQHQKIVEQETQMPELIDAAWIARKTRIEGEKKILDQQIRDLTTQWQAAQNSMRQLKGMAMINFGGGSAAPAPGTTPPPSSTGTETQQETTSRNKAIEEGLKAYEDMTAKIIALRQKQADAMLSKDDQELVSIQDKWQVTIDETQAAIATLMQAAEAGDKTAVGKAKALRSQLEDVYFGLQEEITSKLKEQLAKRNDAEAKALEERIDAALKEGEEIKANRDRVFLELLSDYDRQEQEIIRFYDSEKLLKGLSDQAVIDLEAKKQEKLAELRQKGIIESEQAEKESFTRIAAQVQDLGSYITSAWDAMNQAKTTAENQQLKNYLNNIDKEKDKFGLKLKNKEITQAQYDKKIADLDEKARRKSYDTQVEQFERNKELSLTKAYMGLASGMVAIWTQSFEELGPIAGPILAGIETAALVATTAAEIDTISSSEPPSYGEGKGHFLSEGEPHSGPNGGMPVIDPATGKVVAKVEKGETILPTDTSAANWPMIDWMLNNKGKRFTPTIDANSIPQFSTATATRNIRYDKGGIFDQATARQYNSTQTGAGMPTQPKPDKIEVNLQPLVNSVLAMQKSIEAMQKSIEEKEFVNSLYELNKSQGIKEELKNLNTV